MFSRIAAFAVVAALTFTAAPQPASATVVVAKDFDALCAEADVIFIGTVTDTTSRWTDGSQQAIETLVTFGDLTWLRGKEQPTITLRFSGGTVDGLREEIAGMPHFAVGERRVIFARQGTYVSPVVGFDQGALRVIDGANGPVVVGPGGAAIAPDADGGHRGALRLKAPGTAGDDTTSDASATPQPLDDFVDRVRQRLNSGAVP